jgi:hypothetical protein
MKENFKMRNIRVEGFNCSTDLYLVLVYHLIVQIYFC